MSVRGWLGIYVWEFSDTIIHSLHPHVDTQLHLLNNIPILSL